MCTLCQRIFTAKTKLMSHLTNDHYFDGTEDNLFLCPLCQAKVPTSIGNVQFYCILCRTRNPSPSATPCEAYRREPRYARPPPPPLASLANPPRRSLRSPTPSAARSARQPMPPTQIALRPRCAMENTASIGLGTFNELRCHTRTISGPLRSHP